MWHKFYIMLKNEKLVWIEANPETKEFKLERLCNEHNKLPVPLFNFKPPIREIFEWDNIEFFITNRVFSQGRDDLHDLLDLLGLVKYDPWNICVATHGRISDDPYWLKYEDDNTVWEDVLF